MQSKVSISLKSLLEECKYYIEQNEVRLRSHSGSRLCQTLRRTLAPQQQPTPQLTWQVSKFGSYAGSLGPHTFFIITRAPNLTYQLTCAMRSMLPYPESYQTHSEAVKRAEAALRQFLGETNLILLR